ncbi:MAG: GTPase Era [Caldilineaceae bacterium]
MHQEPGEHPLDNSPNLPNQLPPDHRSGFIAVIGRPNVGKSTLLNRLLGQKIAITSPKPQTTRDQLLGILTEDDAQIMFLDTPGIHKPQHKLGEYMVNIAAETIRDVDVVLWLVDVNIPPKEEDRHIADLLHGLQQKQPLPPLVIGLNKIDQWPTVANEAQFAAIQKRLQDYLSLVQWTSTPAATVVFSGLTGQGIDALRTTLLQRLPLGPRYYPEDQVTDLQLRFMAAELIREKALLLLQQEVPHSIAVDVDEFSERSADMTYISATIYVERASQKGIVLGEGGRMIKKIGQAARPEIEDLVGTRVYLELWVKVWEKWREREGTLKRLGYVVG